MKRTFFIALTITVILSMLTFAVSCKKQSSPNTDINGNTNVGVSDNAKHDTDGQADDNAAGQTGETSDTADEMTEYQP